MSAAVMALWRQQFEAARQANQERRARVLAQPDLAARLCRPPVGYAEPGQWNGYVPPRTLPDDRPYGSTEPESARVNGSPVRAALVGIAAEAMRREGGSE